MSRALVRSSSGRLTWLDRLIGFFSPGAALRRLESRAKIVAWSREYEAASHGRRTHGWRASSGDANALGSYSLARLRNLARDAVRNDGWARSAVGEIANNTVGWGIEPKAKASDPGIAAAADEIWRVWSTSLAADYDGLLWFAGQQHLAMRTIPVSGELLVIRERARSSDGLPVPVRIRLLEGDYLDTDKDGALGPAGPIVQGIELDGAGRRVAYWLYPHHPGSRQHTTYPVSRRVPAKDVLHIYDVSRPGQLRGVSWMAAAIRTLQDLGDFEDAALVQQRVAACFGAFVTDTQGLGTAIGQQQSDPLLEGLEPGMINYLRQGQEITFAQPPQPPPPEFADNQKALVAASLGITPEGLTGKYQKLPFSAARMSRQRLQANVEAWRWHMLIPRFCDGVWRWVMEMGAALNGWAEVPTATWTPPPPPALDPKTESTTWRNEVRSGQVTLFEALRAQGIQDPERHLREIAEANQLLTDLQITLDSDPRKVSLAGQEQPSLLDRDGDS